MITYELAKKLKKVGFLQGGRGNIYFPTGQSLPLQNPLTTNVLVMGKENGETTEELAYVPILSELIEAIKPLIPKGREFRLDSNGDSYVACLWSPIDYEPDYIDLSEDDKEAEIAVARLYLELKKNALRNNQRNPKDIPTQ